jgi:hypothetical protein
MDPMYVICFYWNGDRWYDGKPTEGPYDLHAISKLGSVDQDLASRYVNNLYEGVRRNATREFTFVCFSNEKLNTVNGVEVREFPMYTNYGVMPRVWMFSNETGFAGHQVLCLDLDVVIIGKLYALMGYDGPFCARSKFQPGQEFKLDGDVMSFKAGSWIEDRIWKPFVKDVDAAIDRTQGRERYWMRHTMGDVAERWQSLYPGAVLSYKWHLRRSVPIPKAAEIVSCHGYHVLIYTSIGMGHSIKLGQNYGLVNLFRFADKVETEEGKEYYRFPYWFELLPGNFEVTLHVDLPEDLSKFITKAGLGNPNPQIQKPTL